ncbi:IS5 family transposase [Micromonospora craniellae]|nr:IS5 family transposase [Micromonospora craniellae]QOC93518.1 IS5 family transposase [Micromonospora craniellae]QOC93855.1 IS5 family transposase [Micromonospora craniellae]
MCNVDLGGDDARSCYPSSLTDAMWAILAPLMPVRDLRRGGRPRKWDDRLILDSIFYVLRSGCAWRMMPRDLAPPDAAHRWFTAWRRNGTWDAIHDELRRQVRVAAGRGPEPTAAVLDAQSIKSSEGGECRGFDMGKKTTGRKRHLVVDTMGLILVVMVTSASVNDRPGGRRILQRLAEAFATVALVWADGGYANSIDSSLLSWAKDKLGILLEIVKRTDDVKGFKVLPRRWVVERTFGWLVRNRRLARDYERLTVNSEAMIKVAMIRLMTIRLAGQAVRWSNTTEREAARRINAERLIAT